MEFLLGTLQVVVALGLLNVWLLRRGQSTPYRGGGADSMEEEFKEYRLPVWMMWLVGALKVVASLALIAGFWMPVLVRPAAGLLVVLMAGAVAMHFKRGDPAKRSLPALLVLAMVVVLAIFGGATP